MESRTCRIDGHVIVYSDPASPALPYYLYGYVTGEPTCGLDILRARFIISSSRAKEVLARYPKFNTLSGRILKVVEERKIILEA